MSEHGSRSLFSNEINAGIGALLKLSRDSLFVVGTVTGYVLDGRGMRFRFRQEQETFIFATGSYGLWGALRL
jgi:hypothetical protein